MHSCTKVIEFAAGHRLLDHKGLCQYPHGHNYRAEITIASHHLDGMGMVIDFGDIKEVVGGWIKKNWDHAFVVGAEDEELRDALARLTAAKIFIMPENPTAEAMALHLAQVVTKKIIMPSQGYQLTKLRLWETSTSFGEYHPGT